MSRLSFFFKRLVRMDWHKMWKTTAILKKRSGRSRLWLLMDMLRCGVRYNAGYMDYMIAEMYRLNDEQKRSVRILADCSGRMLLATTTRSSPIGSSGSAAR